MPKAKKKTAAKKKVVQSKKKIVKKAVKKVVKKAVKKPGKKSVAKRKKVSAIPKSYRSVTPYIIVNGGMKAIEFYKKAFGAKAVVCTEQAGGRVGHCELTIGDSKIMLSDGCSEMGVFSPMYFGGSPVGMYLYVKDVDVVVKRAVAAGAKLVRPVEDMFYGDRSGAIVDPYGHNWYIATHIEDVTLKQIRKRAAELYGN